MLPVKDCSSLSKKSNGIAIKKTAKASFESSDEEKEGEKIRVGRDFQAVPPPLMPQKDKDLEEEERSVLVWAPPPSKDILNDSDLDNFISVAKDDYGYNQEQALGIVFWHGYNVDKASKDIVNFLPYPDRWDLQDKVMFEQAFQYYGKSFRRIRQMLPNKSIADLVEYYYNWKKSRCRSSMIEHLVQKLVEAREEGLCVEDNNILKVLETNKDHLNNDVIDDNIIKQLNGNSGVRFDCDIGTSKKADINDSFFRKLDKSIVRCKDLVQQNKQFISTLLVKRKQNDIEPSRLNAPEFTICDRWTDEEMTLCAHGVKVLGKDFLTIASIMGTKTEDHVKKFYNIYKQKLGLE